MTGADADSIASIGWSLGTAGTGANAFIVAGAFRDATFGPETGAAYVFRYEGTGWLEEQKLLASDAHANDSFGLASTAFSDAEGDFIVVGAHNWSAFGMRGAAYIFHFDHDTMAWQEESRLTASDGENGDRFGRAVAMVDSLVIVASPVDDDVGEDAGAVYAFRRTSDGAGGVTWLEEYKLVASDGLPSDAFGRAVGIARTSVGDAVCVVGPSSPDAHPAGALYIYQRETDINGEASWAEEAILTAVDGVEFDHLGWAASVAGTNAGVFALGGAPGATVAGMSSGAAYLFRREENGQGGFQWIEEAKLVASDGAIADAFGWSVSIADSPLGVVALVGTRSDDNFRGAAYAFLRRDDGVWDEVAKLVASDGQSGDFLGYSSVIGPDWFVVSAPRDDPMGAPAGRGAVYTYDLRTVATATNDANPTFDQTSVRTWPNPFSTRVFVLYRLLEPGQVEFIVFDVLGRAVVRIDDVFRPTGEFVETIDLDHLPTGRYLLQLTTPNGVTTETLTKVRVAD